MTPSKLTIVPIKTGHIDQIYLYQLTINFDKNIDLSLLNNDEQKKVNSFISHHDKARFVQTRIALKQLIANHLQQDVKTINFDYNKYGKPFLTDNPLYFNVSHSHDTALIAIAKNYHVGIDIEQASKVNNLQSELKKLVYAQNDDMQRLTFAQMWVIKEAVVKAIGTGLQTAMTDFAVQYDDNQLGIIGDGQQFANMQAFLLDITGDYVACIAMKKVSVHDNFYN